MINDESYEMDTTRVYENYQVDIVLLMMCKIKKRNKMMLSHLMFSFYQDWILDRPLI